MEPSCRRGMKARPFLAVLLTIALVALTLGGVGWWLVWQRSPLGLQHRSAQLPRAARFVPRQAPFSLYLLSDGREPVAYARAVAPARQRRQAAERVEQLRDGAFAAAGLDYRQELAPWLAPEIALALYDTVPAAVRPGATAFPPGGGATEGPNWLLALSSRDAEGARRFLQRFWQTRSLAGADLQVSTYRGMGLISGRGALAGGASVPLATALVDDDLLLIASGRGVLEEALDVSQIDELNQAGDPALARRFEGLGPAAALVVAQAGGLEHGLGWPEGGQLLAAVRPDGPSLRLEALLRPPAPTAADQRASVAVPAGEQAPAAGAEPSAVGAPGEAVADGAAAVPPAVAATDQPAALASAPKLPALGAVPTGSAASPPPESLLEAAPAGSDRLALLVNPAALGRIPALGPLLQQVSGLGPAAGPLPPLLLAAAEGPLLVADGPAGWLLATPLDQPPLQALEAPLAAEGLIAAPLELADGAVTVWTRLETGGRRAARAERGGVDRLQAPLEAWRAERRQLALWGRSLSLLEGEEAARGARGRERQLEAVALPGASLSWALAEAPARQLLRGWQPWRQLSALAGAALEQPVQGLAGSARRAEGEGAGELRIRARLDFPAAG